MQNPALHGSGLQAAPELLETLARTEASIESFLLESYAHSGYSNPWQKAALAAYYGIRPLFSDRVRASLQRGCLLNRTASFPSWPVDFTADTLLENELAGLMRDAGQESVPFIWFWPEGCTACAVVTHDVETEVGKRLCEKLLGVNRSFGIRESFQIIPEGRYQVSPSFLDDVRSLGAEIAVHDLNHDGKLFLNHATFMKRVGAMNRYGKEFGARGFRAGVMYRNQRWFSELDFEFDMSVPNSAKFEPQAGGCCSVMPYFIDRLLEIPLTTAQDYTLFHILREFSPDLWFQQVDAIHRRHGLISVLTHPDYIMEPNALATYKLLLRRLASLRDKDGLWITTPCELNDWWRQRSGLKLEIRNGEWRILGDGAARACVAHAVLSGDSIQYELKEKKLCGLQTY